MEIYNSIIKGTSNISSKERHEFINKYILGDDSTKQDIINSYQPQIILIALQYVGNGLSLEDLIQEGNIGLLDGMEKIRKDKKNHYSSIINLCINRSIEIAIRKYNNIENYEVKHISKRHLIVIIKELKNELLKNPNIEEIYNELISNIDECELPNIVSLENTSYEIVEDDTYNPELITLDSEKIYENRILKIIENSNLSEKQKKLIIERYGLLDDEPLTISEIAEYNNVSKQTLYEIHGSAIEKLRKNPRLKKLKDPNYLPKEFFIIKETKATSEEYKSTINNAKNYKQTRVIEDIIKKELQTLLPHCDEKTIEDIINSLTPNDLIILKKSIIYKDKSFNREFNDIIKNILKTYNLPTIKGEKTKVLPKCNNKVEEANNLLKIAEGKADIVCYSLNKLSKLKDSKSEYELIIEYEKTDELYHDENYTYYFHLYENGLNGIKEILNISYNLKNYIDGLNIITKIINNFSQNTKIISSDFDLLGYSRIINDSQIKIITELKTPEEIEMFTQLHNQLNINKQKHNVNVKIIN